MRRVVLVILRVVTLESTTITPKITLRRTQGFTHAILYLALSVSDGSVR